MIRLLLTMDDHSKFVLTDMLTGKLQHKPFDSFREALTYVDTVYNSYRLELTPDFVRRY